MLDLLLFIFLKNPFKFTRNNASKLSKKYFLIKQKDRLKDGLLCFLLIKFKPASSLILHQSFHNPLLLVQSSSSHGHYLPILFHTFAHYEWQ